MAAARTATAHLAAQGRVHVAAIGDQPNSSQESGVAHLRRRGWEEALRSAGLPVVPELVAEVPAYRRGSGAAAMATLLDRGHPMDAVFCFNDTLALGALRVLAERGRRVPEDVAVIGLDDVDDARFAVPSLSTIAPDKAFIARTAVSMLAERLEEGGQDIAPRDVRAPFELVVRESTGGRPTTTSRVQ